MSTQSVCYDRAPMGWNSWDCYGAAVTEETVRKNAEYMAKNLKQYGWEYVVVDIQWSEPDSISHEYRPFADLCMDEYGRLIPAENRFPSAAGGKGFKPLSDYVHSLGLKFGIHIMRGIPRVAVHRNLPVKGTGVTAREIAKTNSICHWNMDMYGVDPAKEGAREYYDSIFELYASWGVDFIKCDDICRELPHEESEMVMLSESLHACGREMILSLSPGPAQVDRAELYKEVSNMWRITDDFWDEWRLLYAMFERAEKWCIHAGAGHWPDADMLPIGAVRQCYDPSAWTKFTEEEQVTMMNLWCMMRSPLMIGAEMTKFDDFTLDLVTNQQLLDLHKNSRYAHPVWRKEIDGNEMTLWMAVDKRGGIYAGLFNLSDNDAEGEIDLADMEITEAMSGTEIWTGEKAEQVQKINVKLKPHASVVYHLV